MSFDAATAVQQAAMTSLDVAEVTSLGAEVWAHPPEVEADADPLASVAWILIHGITLAPEGGKDGGLDRATLTIATLIRKPGPSHLSSMQAVVRDRLEGQPFSAPGAIMSQPVQTSTSGELMDDGATYLGTQTFETLVQAAG